MPRRRINGYFRRVKGRRVRVRGHIRNYPYAKMKKKAKKMYKKGKRKMRRY